MALPPGGQAAGKELIKQSTAIDMDSESDDETANLMIKSNEMEISGERREANSLDDSSPLEENIVSDKSEQEGLIQVLAAAAGSQSQQHSALSSLQKKRLGKQQEKEDLMMADVSAVKTVISRLQAILKGSSSFLEVTFGESDRYSEDSFLSLIMAKPYLNKGVTNEGYKEAANLVLAFLETQTSSNEGIAKKIRCFLSLKDSKKQMTVLEQATLMWDKDTVERLLILSGVRDITTQANHLRDILCTIPLAQIKPEELKHFLNWDCNSTEKKELLEANIVSLTSVLDRVGKILDLKDDEFTSSCSFAPVSYGSNLVTESFLQLLLVKCMDDTKLNSEASKKAVEEVLKYLEKRSGKSKKKTNVMIAVLLNMKSSQGMTVLDQATKMWGKDFQISGGEKSSMKWEKKVVQRVLRLGGVHAMGLQENEAIQLRNADIKETEKVLKKFFEVISCSFDSSSLFKLQEIITFKNPASGDNESFLHLLMQNFNEECLSKVEYKHTIDRVISGLEMKAATSDTNKKKIVALLKMKSGKGFSVLDHVTMNWELFSATPKPDNMKWKKDVIKRLLTLGGVSAWGLSEDEMQGLKQANVNTINQILKKLDTVLALDDLNSVSSFAPITGINEEGENEPFLHMIMCKCSGSKVNSKIAINMVLSFLEKKASNGILKERIKMLMSLTESGKGQTVLHLAATKKEKNTEILRLLNLGADITTKNAYGATPLVDMDSEVLEDFLDSKWTYEPKDTDPSEFIIKFDFSFLQASPQWALTLAQSKHRELLNHPVVFTLLDLKWDKILPAYFLNIIFTFVLCNVTTLFVLGNYGGDSIGLPGFSRLNTSKRANECINMTPFPSVFEEHICFRTLLWISLVICTTMLAIREALQIYGSAKNGTLKEHFLDDFFTNMLEWVFILLSYFIIVSTSILDHPLCVSPITRAIAATILLITWILLINMLAMIPYFHRQKIYLAMFQQVMKKFGLVFIIFAPYIIAVGLFFFISMQKSSKHDYNQKIGDEQLGANNIKILLDKLDEKGEFFDTAGLAVVKTMAMFIGELDFSDIPFDNLPYFSHVTFVIFISFFVICLMNLLTGLAVSILLFLLHYLIMTFYLAGW